MGDNSLKASDYIAIFSALIAMAALAATFWQAAIARAHNRLSVQPRIDWGTDRYPGRPVCLFIENAGLGPAVIEQFTLVFDGKQYVNPPDLPPAVHDQIAELRGDVDWLMFSGPAPMASGTRFQLFKATFDSADLTGHNEAVKFMDRLGFILEYSSMYGERFVLKRDTAPPQVQKR